MLCSRDQSQRLEKVPVFTSVDARRWGLRLVLFLAGVGLFLASPSHYQHRSLELFIGIAIIATCVLHAVIDLLLTFAAKTVKPRKLGND